MAGGFVRYDAVAESPDGFVREVSPAGAIGGSASRPPLTWAAVTLASAGLAVLAVRPRRCQDVAACVGPDGPEGMTMGPWHLYAIVALATELLIELVALRYTWASARPLVGMLVGVEQTFVPPVLMCTAFAALIAENTLVALRWFVHAAAAGVGGTAARPVYSAIYIEWLINVPILLVLSGYCAMKRPLAEISRPLIVTNVYIILSWCAYFIASATARWVVVAIAFAMYGWASVDMVGWVMSFRAATNKDLPARAIRSALAVGLIVVFFVYGMIYLAAMVGYMSSLQELTFYITMDIFVKLAFLVAFVGIRSSQFYELLMSLLVNNSSEFYDQIATDTGFGGVQKEGTAPLVEGARPALVEGATPLVD